MNKPSNVQIAGALLLAGGIWSLLFALAMTVATFCIWVPSYTYSITAAIIAIVKGAQLLGDCQGRGTPTVTAILQICQIVQGDLIGMTLGIIALVLLSDDTSKAYLEGTSMGYMGAGYGYGQQAHMAQAQAYGGAPGHGYGNQYNAHPQSSPAGQGYGGGYQQPPPQQLPQQAGLPPASPAWGQPEESQAASPVPSPATDPGKPWSPDDGSSLPSSPPPSPPPSPIVTESTEASDGGGFGVGWEPAAPLQTEPGGYGGRPGTGTASEDLATAKSGTRIESYGDDTPNPYGQTEAASLDRYRIAPWGDEDDEEGQEAPAVAGVGVGKKSES